MPKTPWLTALTAWHTQGTWTGGCEFARDNSLTISASMDKKPFHGSYPYRVTVRDLDGDWVRRDLQNELNRGWRPLSQEAAKGLPREMRQAVLIERIRPGGDHALVLAHTGTDVQRHGVEGVQVTYLRKEADGAFTPLPEAVWADWDSEGRLLMATRDGLVTITDRQSGSWARIWSQDLAVLGSVYNDDPVPSDSTKFVKNLPSHRYRYRWFAYGTFDRGLYPLIKNVGLRASC